MKIASISSAALATLALLAGLATTQAENLDPTPIDQNLESAQPSQDVDSIYSKTYAIASGSTLKLRYKDTRAVLNRCSGEVMIKKLETFFATLELHCQGDENLPNSPSPTNSGVSIDLVGRNFNRLLLNPKDPNELAHAFKLIAAELHINGIKQDTIIFMTHPKVRISKHGYRDYVWKLRAVLDDPTYRPRKFGKFNATLLLTELK